MAPKKKRGLPHFTLVGRHSLFRGIILIFRRLQAIACLAEKAQKIIWLCIKLSIMLTFLNKIKLINNMRSYYEDAWGVLA